MNHYNDAETGKSTRNTFLPRTCSIPPRLSDVSALLRTLTETLSGCEWKLTKKQDVSFETIKATIMQGLDASSKGLVATILQQVRPISYASKALTAAQRNYAKIEKETLAVVFECDKFHFYIYGRPITVESDHKPLEYIFLQLPCVTKITSCRPEI